MLKVFSSMSLNKKMRLQKKAPLTNHRIAFLLSCLCSLQVSFYKLPKSCFCCYSRFLIGFLTTNFGDFLCHSNAPFSDFPRLKAVFPIQAEFEHSSKWKTTNCFFYEASSLESLVLSSLHNQIFQTRIFYQNTGFPACQTS